MGHASCLPLYGFIVNVVTAGEYFCSVFVLREQRRRHTVQDDFAANSDLQLTLSKAVYCLDCIYPIIQVHLERIIDGQFIGDTFLHLKLPFLIVRSGC